MSPSSGTDPDECGRGCRGPAGVCEHRGEFTVVDRPSKLVFTWIAEATDHLPTLVTVEFFALGMTECEVVLTHERFPRMPARDRYKGGWSQILDRLERHWLSKKRWKNPGPHWKE